MLNQEKVNAASAGYRAVFNERLNSADTVARKIALAVPSKNSSETWTWLENLAEMKELIGEAEVSNIAAQSYTIPNKEFVATVEVPQAVIERDALGMYKPAIEELADEANYLDDKRVASLLLGGFSQTGYDGKAFFATNHKYAGSEKQWSNKLTAKLSVESFEKARAMIKTIKKANGSPFGNGRKLVLVCSAKNESLARQILNAETIGGTTNVNKGTAELIVWNEIDVANEDAWFIIETGKAFKPVVIQEEVKTTLNVCDKLDDSYVIDHHKFKYQAYKRAGYGYGLPQLAVGSDGSKAA